MMGEVHSGRSSTRKWGWVNVDVSVSSTLVSSSSNVPLPSVWWGGERRHKDKRKDHFVAHILSRLCVLSSQLMVLRALSPDTGWVSQFRWVALATTVVYGGKVEVLIAFGNSRVFSGIYNTFACLCFFAFPTLVKLLHFMHCLFYNLPVLIKAYRCFKFLDSTQFSAWKTVV